MALNIDYHYSLASLCRYLIYSHVKVLLQSIFFKFFIFLLFGLNFLLFWHVFSFLIGFLCRYVNNVNVADLENILESVCRWLQKYYQYNIFLYPWIIFAFRWETYLVTFVSTIHRNRFFLTFSSKTGFSCRLVLSDYRFCGLCHPSQYLYRDENILMIFQNLEVCPESIEWFCRGPGFLVVVWFDSTLTPSLPPLSR